MLTHVLINYIKLQKHCKQNLELRVISTKNKSKNEADLSVQVNDLYLLKNIGIFFLFYVNFMILALIQMKLKFFLSN